MTLPPIPRHDDAPLPSGIASGLRNLGGDIAPDRDLWPSIAGRLEPRTTASRAAKPLVAPRRFRRRDAGYAAAAAVVLTVAAGWHLLPMRPTPGPGTDPVDVVAAGAAADADAPLLRAADALAREYQGAMREAQATTRAPFAGDAATAATAAGVDDELERSAAEVRAALARDPDALHLFHRLQRIYAHRLALNLRQA